MIFIIYFVMIFSSVVLILADYSYKNPDDWKIDYPDCGGSEQSPIDVSCGYDLIAHFNETGYGILFKNYGTLPEKMILKNDGHTLKVIYDWADGEEEIPQVSGGNLESIYRLHSFQFRWGSNINNGTEHKLYEDNTFSMEIQLVHYDLEFSNYEEAEGHQKGILIHTAFFFIGAEESEFLTKITEKISEVIQPNTEIEIEPFSVEILYQKSDRRAFIIYDGSLTHPPCTESIFWMISDKVFEATEEQLQLFHTVKLLNDDNHNNRQLQEKNGRKSTLVHQEEYKG